MGGESKVTLQCFEKCIFFWHYYCNDRSQMRKCLRRSGIPLFFCLFSWHDSEPLHLYSGGKGFCIGITINRETATKLHQLSHRETRMSGSEISDTTLKMPQCSRVPESVAVTVVNSVHSIALPNELMASLCVCVCLCFCVCGPVIFGARVLLYLHSVLAPSCVCDRFVPHSVASVWLLACWCAHRGLVHP